MPKLNAKKWPGLSPRAETMDPMVTSLQGPSSGPSPTHSNANRPEFGGGRCGSESVQERGTSALSAAAAVSLGIPSTSMTTASLDDEDESLAQFLESEVLSHVSDQEDTKTTTMTTRPSKRQRVEDEGTSQVVDCSCKSPKRIESGFFSKIPPELFHHILKFLSSEDLVSCSLVCSFLNFAASDEFLWRRLYCMRWGLSSPAGKLRACAWKTLYIQRDEEDMIEFVKNTPSEFKEYYIQMQAAKRSQAPLPSQVNDDYIVLDKTVADQVSMWKSSRGLTDAVVADHACSGSTCSYSQIGEMFLCEKTGRVHACDDSCRESVLDPSNGLLVCPISGHCFDRWLLPSEEEEADPEQQQGGVGDEAEPFMGSGRFARAYLLGYNCADEKELERTLRFC